MELVWKEVIELETRKKNIVNICIKTGIGFLVAFFVMSQIEPDWSWRSWAIMAMFFSAVPCGWSLINRVIGRVWVLDGAAIAIGLFVKLLLSLLIGWVVVPVSLLWNIGMYFWEKHKETEVPECIED